MLCLFWQVAETWVERGDRKAQVIQGGPASSSTGPGCAGFDRRVCRWKERHFLGDESASSVSTVVTRILILGYEPSQDRTASGLTYTD